MMKKLNKIYLHIENQIIHIKEGMNFLQHKISCITRKNQTVFLETPIKSPGVKKTASPGVKKEKKPKTPEIKEEAMIKTEVLFLYNKIDYGFKTKVSPFHTIQITKSWF